MGKLESEIGGT